MKLFKFLFRQSPSVILLGILGASLGGLATTGLFVLINHALTGGAGQLGKWRAWIFLGFCLAVPVSRAVSTYVLVKLGQQAAFDLRMRLIRQILASPLRRLEELGSPRLLTVLVNDVLAVTVTLLSFPSLCLHGTLLVGSLVYLGTISWFVLLIVVGFLALGFVSYRLPMAAAKRYQREVRERADALQKQLREVTEGIKELTIHDERQRAFLKLVGKTGDDLRHLSVKAMTIFSAATGWGQLLFFLAIGLLLFVLPELHQVERQTMTAYTIVLLYMLTPIQVILAELPQLSNAGVSMQNIERIGLSLTEPADYPPARTPAVWRAIELVGIVHSFYREDKIGSFTLGPLDFSLTPGELVFLIGGNGSGKTTLAKIILGLYVPEAGQVLLDGKPLGEADLRAYRQLFSAVFSDFFLFDSFLGLARPEFDAQARAYLAQLQLDKKVEVRDGNLSTTALSQGQRKRLALLTAYLEDRPIYLFDEWAADQDPVFKEVFYHHLLPELRSRGKTIVVISHDDRYYDVADRIVKLDYGQLAYDRRVRPHAAAETLA
jgi:putative ATP-binding cassette transporter